MKFTPAKHRIEIRPLTAQREIQSDKEELVELGEVVSDYQDTDFLVIFVKKGDILAFEGWGCTKITHEGKDHWVVSTDKNVILGKFTKDGEK